MTKQIFLIVSLSFVIGSCSHLSDISSNFHSAKKAKMESRSKDFSVRWAKNLDPVQQTGNLPVALNSPLVYKGVLFAGDGEGHMSAYELGNGRLIWKSKDNNYYHQRPIVHKDHLIYGSVEGRVYSRHYLTGKIKFEVDLDTSIESAGVVSNGRLYFHLRNHKLFSLDVETGKILWAYRRSVPFLTTVQKVSRPLVIKNRLYVGFADGSVACFAVEDGNLLWEQRLSTGLKFVDVDASPILYKGKLVVGSMSGKVSFLDPSSGSVVRNLPYSIARSAVAADDGLYLVTIDGELLRYSHEGKEDLKKVISLKSLGDFKVDGKSIYLGTLDGRFLELNRSDFKINRELELGHEQSAIFGELSLSKDTLAFISSRYRLYVLEK
jgi:outer membrane protein assembly factor BamB